MTTTMIAVILISDYNITATTVADLLKMVLIVFWLTMTTIAVILISDHNKNWGHDHSSCKKWL